MLNTLTKYKYKYNNIVLYDRFYETFGKNNGKLGMADVILVMATERSHLNLDRITK